MEDKISIYINYKYTCLVFENIDIFKYKIQKYFKNNSYICTKNNFLAFLFMNFKIKLVNRKMKNKKKEMKDSYTCDIVNFGYSVSFVIADKYGKILSLKR